MSIFCFSFSVFYFFAKRFSTSARKGSGIASSRIQIQPHRSFRPLGPPRLQRMLAFPPREVLRLPAYMVPSAASGLIRRAQTELV